MVQKRTIKEDVLLVMQISIINIKIRIPEGTTITILYMA